RPPRLLRLLLSAVLSTPPPRRSARGHDRRDRLPQVFPRQLRPTPRPGSNLALVKRRRSSLNQPRSDSFHSASSSWIVLPVSSLKHSSLYWPWRISAFSLRTMSLSYFSQTKPKNAAVTW